MSTGEKNKEIKAWKMNIDSAFIQLIYKGMPHTSKFRSEISLLAFLPWDSFIITLNS